MREQIDGITLIARERLRQVSQEGWSEYHDDGHEYDELAIAAACYALPDRKRESERRLGAIPLLWPWDFKWWKPTPHDRIRELVKAGALIAAEIDRLQRLNVEGGETELVKAGVTRTCGECGNAPTEVRPGKYQCDYCESAEPVDEMTVTVTASQLMNRGIWLEACTLLGINEWAVKEGLMEYSHKIEMTELQARKIGVIQ